MKIIMSAYSMKPPLTGIGIYTRHLFHGLNQSKQVSELICIPQNDINNQKIVKKKYFFINKMIKSLPGTYAALNHYRDITFRRKTLLLSEKDFIYHEPSYILRPYSGLKVCTVHDLSHLHYPQCHPRERVNFLSKQLAKSITSAHHIITGSDFVRNEIIDFFKVSPHKVSVVYHGVSKRYRPYTQNDLRPILARYQLMEKKYLLCVATLEPRKNLERLIQAFCQLPRRLRQKYPLVLIGSKGWGSAKLEKLMDQLVRKNEIYWLGYVSAFDLPYLYAGAIAFLYLSIYEGFGLPILEALASGVPCIVSDVSSMPEVVGNAGLRVNPFDIELITARLNQVLNDSSLRDDLKDKGITQASKFSWETCITNTLRVYESILASLSVTVLRS